MLQKWFNTSTPCCDHEIISFHKTHGQEDVKTRCEEPDVEAKRREEEEEEAVASILEEVAEKIDPAVHTFENSVMCQSMTGTWRVLT